MIFLKLIGLGRYAGAPVDFEEVALDSSVSDVGELDNALLAIKRNGIALKGIK